MLRYILARLSKMSTFQLILIPLVISILPFAIVAGLSALGYRGTILQGILTLMMFFLWDLTGVPIIIRKEVPSTFYPVKGWQAIAAGILLILGGCLVLQYCSQHCLVSSEA
jgi:hypothetical protein